MNLNLLLLTFFSVFALASSNSEGNKECNAIEVCLTSEQFISSYKLCEKDNTEIIIFDNTNIFKKCEDYEISCNKKVVVEQSQIKIDASLSSLDKSDKIVLYQYEYFGNRSRIYFLNLKTNQRLTFDLNKKLEITNVEKENF